MFSYNPGISDRSGELMAMGIYRAGDALGQSMQNIGQDIGQARNEAKAADVLYKAMMPEDGMDGSKSPHPIMPKDKWDSLGWNDKRSTMAGVIKSIGIQQVQEETRRRNQQLAAELEQQNRMNAQNDAFGGAMNRLAIGSSLDKMRTMGGAPRPDAPTREQLLAAVMSNPLAAQSRGGQAMILQAMDPQQTKNDYGTPEYSQDPVTGQRVVFRGGQMLPSGTDPKMVGNAFSNLPTIPGHRPAPNGKGGIMWVRTPDNTLSLEENIKLLQLQQKLLEKDFSADRETKQAALEQVIKDLLRQAAGTKSASQPSAKGNDRDPLGLFQ